MHNLKIPFQKLFLVFPLAMGVYRTYIFLFKELRFFLFFSTTGGLLGKIRDSVTGWLKRQQQSRVTNYCSSVVTFQLSNNHFYPFRWLTSSWLRG